MPEGAAVPCLPPSPLALPARTAARTAAPLPGCCAASVWPPALPGAALTREGVRPPALPGAALTPEGVRPLSHSAPPPLRQSYRSLAPPAFPLRGGGLGSPLSLSALFAASPLRFCHRRKGHSARTSAPEPFTFSSFAEMKQEDLAIDRPQSGAPRNSLTGLESYNPWAEYSRLYGNGGI